MDSPPPLPPTPRLFIRRTQQQTVRSGSSAPDLTMENLTIRAMAKERSKLDIFQASLVGTVLLFVSLCQLLIALKRGQQVVCIDASSPPDILDARCESSEPLCNQSTQQNHHTGIEPSEYHQKHLWACATIFVSFLPLKYCNKAVVTSSEYRKIFFRYSTGLAALVGLGSSPTDRMASSHPVGSQLRSTAAKGRVTRLCITIATHALAIECGEAEGFRSMLMS